ncbi:uncharacterized protein LOC114933231 [Nylanderia fulva]|uniref:uncharacterized protein LOC114933231 n=1 Tax=Nylanderia fulva TaxID=613905 RepID=UPI0010FB5FAB|nr:uncharacterized protein LOC114933231 [Nylanderia fulva]
MGRGERDRTYASVLSEAKSKIDAKELGIESMHMRRGVTGSILLSVRGRDSSVKADALAEKMKEVFPSSGTIRVGRPSRTEDIRIKGMMAFVGRQDILDRVASVGGCKAEDLQAGVIRLSPGTGFGTLWIRCPSGVARRLVAAGSIVMSGDGRG